MAIEYLVALPIDKMRHGDTYRHGESLPLHCTLMHWFRLDEEQSDLRTRLSQKLTSIAGSREHDSVKMRSGGRALFGPQGDVPVTLLHRNVPLELMHTELLLFLALWQSAPKVLQWIGAGYRPHVADVNGHMFAPHRQRTARTLVLAERVDGGTKTIVEEHKIGMPL